MKSKILISLIILSVLFSLTAVSAAENQTEIISDMSDDSLSSINQSDVICEASDYHPSSEFNQKILESGDELNLTCDYKYDGNLIKISKDNKFVINGNGHVFDELGGIFFI